MVVFDLGGVLIRICRSWAEACGRAGLPVRGESGSISASGTRHALAERHGLGLIESGEFYREVSRAMGGLYSPDEVESVHDAWLIGEYAGVGELIRGLRSRGVMTGVLSNTNHSHWVRLVTPAHGGTGEFDASGLPEHLHASHLMRMLKPSREIYGEFERRTGFAGRGGHILFFDDLAENVSAARGCGWQAEQIDHAGDTAEQMRGHLTARGLEM